MNIGPQLNTSKYVVIAPKNAFTGSKIEEMIISIFIAGILQVEHCRSIN